MKVTVILMASLMTSYCVLGAPGQIRDRMKESFEESLEETIQEAKTEVHDEVQEDIATAKEAVRENLEAKLKQTVEEILIQFKPEIQDDLMELQQEINEVRQEVSEVRAQIRAQVDAKAENLRQTIQVRMQEIRQKIYEIQGNFNALQQKIYSIRQQIPVIQEQIAAIREDISQAINDEIAKLHQEFASRFQARLASIEQKLQMIAPEVQKVLEVLDEISQRLDMRVEQIEQRINQVEERISGVEQRIQQIKMEIPQIEAYLSEVKQEVEKKIEQLQLQGHLKAILLQAELEFEEMETKMEAIQSVRNGSVTLTPEQILLLKHISESQKPQRGHTEFDLSQLLLEKILLDEGNLTPEQILLLQNVKSRQDSSHHSHETLMSVEQKVLEEKLKQGVQLNHEELLKLAEHRARRSGRSILEELFLLHHVSVTPQQLILLKSFTPSQILNYFFLQNVGDFSIGDGFIDSLVHHLSELGRAAALVNNNEIVLYNFLKTHHLGGHHLSLAELSLMNSYHESMTRSMRRSRFLLMMSLMDVMNSDDVTQQQKLQAETMLHRVRAENSQMWQEEELALLRRYAQGKSSLAATVAAYRRLEAMNSGLVSDLRSLAMNMVRINLVKGSGIGMNMQGEWMRGFLSNAEWQNATESEKIHEIWVLYKLRHHKSYRGRLEESMRRRHFERRLSEIVMHNIEYQLGKHLFTMGLNHLSDRSDEEVTQLRGYITTAQVQTALAAQAADVAEGEAAPSTVPVMPYYKSTAGASLPAYVNWINTSWVGPIQDQYQCGSCWSFSTAGALEAQYYNKTKTFVAMSEQNLVDCTYYLGNLGCSGGNMQLAFDYVMTTGIDTYASYPYTGRANNGSCKYNPANSVTTDSGWMLIPPSDEAAMQQAVAQVGPVSAAIDASLSSFDSYTGGVYAPANCSTTALDHAILVVGYGTTDEGQDYWLIKNSWGVDWGMQGYMMMARGVNMCGIATEALFPLIN